MDILNMKKAFDLNAELDRLNRDIRTAEKILESGDGFHMITEKDFSGYNLHIMFDKDGNYHPVYKKLLNVYLEELSSRILEIHKEIELL